MERVLKFYSAPTPGVVELLKGWLLSQRFASLHCQQKPQTRWAWQQFYSKKNIFSVFWVAKKVSHPYSGALSLKFWGFWGFLSSSNSCLGAIFVLIWDFLRCFLSSCGFRCSSEDKKLNFSWFSFKKNPSQNIKNGKALLSFCCEMKRREGTARHLNFVTTRSNLGQKNNLLLFF